MVLHAVMAMASSLMMHAFAVRAILMHAITMHPPRFARWRTLRLGLRLHARTHRGLTAAQGLRPTLDFGHTCGIGAFTNAAFRRLRECASCGHYQRQHRKRNALHFHDDLS